MNEHVIFPHFSWTEECYNNT